MSGIKNIRKQESGGEAPFLRVLSPCAAREAPFLKLATRPQPCGGGSKPPEKSFETGPGLARERATRHGRLSRRRDGAERALRHRAIGAASCGDRADEHAHGQMNMLMHETA